MKGAAAALLVVAACGRLGFDGDRGRQVDASEAAADTDADGVVDDLDNCAALANPTQHDEDRDGRGDACDGCPHRAAATIDDGDGDGVEDACDPSNAADNRIEVFAGFGAGDDVSGWLAQVSSGAGWTVGDDALHVALPDAEVGLYTWPSPAGTTVRVEARVDVEVIAPPFPGFAFRNVSLVDHVSGTPPMEDALFLGLNQDTSGPVPVALSIIQLIDGGNAGSLADGMLANDLATTTYELRYGRAGINRQIDVLVPAPSQVQVDVVGEGGGIGVRIRGLTVAIAYIVVIA